MQWPVRITAPVTHTEDHFSPRKIASKNLASKVIAEHRRLCAEV
jgi:hypothetical protein